MPNFKPIDIYVDVQAARLVWAAGGIVNGNILPQQPIRGDQLLLRWHLQASDLGSAAAFALDAGTKFEFLLSNAFGSTIAQCAAYSDDSEFNPVDWGSYSLAGGLICCRVDLDADKLVSDLGRLLNGKLYYGELVATVPPTSAGEHLTLWQGQVNVRNDLYRAGTGEITLTANPPSQESSSESCSSPSCSSLSCSCSSLSSLSSASCSSSSVSVSSLSTLSSQSSASSSSCSCSPSSQSISTQSSASSCSTSAGFSSSSCSCSASSLSTLSSESCSTSAGLSSSSCSFSASSSSAGLSSSSSCSGYDPNTLLLLPFDGADGATATTDISGGGVDSPHAVTFYGNAQLDTAQSKFGGAALLLDGTTDYVTVPDSADWEFGAGNFTIEMWVRFAVGPGSVLLWEQYQDGSNLAQFYIYGSIGAYHLYFSVSGLGLKDVLVGAIALDAWHHVAFARSGNTAALYLDGVQVGTLDVTGQSCVSLAAVGSIGARNDGSNALNGWIDEFRISNVARYTGNFTPPTEAFTP